MKEENIPEYFDLLEKQTLALDTHCKTGKLFDHLKIGIITSESPRLIKRGTERERSRKLKKKRAKSHFVYDPFV